MNKSVKILTLICVLNEIIESKRREIYKFIEYSDLCKVEAITVELDTSSKFYQKLEADYYSPIDLYVENTKKLNKLIGESYNSTLGNLLLLGYVSAAESYIRALIRELVNSDEYIKLLVSEKNVSFAAAIHHKREILPDALLEDFSLASPYNVFETLKDLVGLKGPRPKPLVLPSSEFRKVCELRHCCVHRFGNLGSKNAIRLGLHTHSDHLESTISLSRADIEEIAFIVDNFVKSLNNYLFKFVLERSVKNKDDEGKPLYEENWLWDYELDKSRFTKYYRIFNTNNDVVRSMSIEQCYQKFCDNNKVAKEQNLPLRKSKSKMASSNKVL